MRKKIRKGKTDHGEENTCEKEESAVTGLSGMVLDESRVNRAKKTETRDYNSRAQIFLLSITLLVRS